VAVPHDASLIVSASFDHSIRIWDIDTGNGTNMLSVGACIHWVIFSPDANLAMSASRDGYGWWLTGNKHKVLLLPPFSTSPRARQYQNLVLPLSPK
jgi:WD40 repeat protein